jgi:RNA-binding protein 39
VAGLNPKLSESEVRPIFEAFGPLTFIDLHRDHETGKFKGIATIGFRNPPDAKNAVITMNGFPLADRTLRVGWVRERSGPIVVGLDFERIDDDGGAALGQINRTDLMAKLARERGVEMPGYTDLARPAPSETSSNAMAEPSSAVPAMVQAPTRNCVLRNMFTPSEETEPNWQDEIKQDVMEECSKFGKILHIAVDADDPDGCVYMRFETVEACEDAVQTLHGRWFAKKRIEASFLVDAIYEARFPL